MPSKKIVVERYGWEPGDVVQDTDQQCLKAKVVKGFLAYWWMRWGNDGKCPTSPELNNFYATRDFDNEFVQKQYVNSLLIRKDYIQ